MNQVILMGRITHDLELKGTQTGKNYLRFSVAVNRNSGKNKTTDFINCVAWQQTGEFIAKYFNRGDMIALSGRLENSSVQEGQSTKKYCSVVVNRAYFCGKENRSTNTQQKAQNIESELDNFSDLDLPF